MNHASVLLIILGGISAGLIHVYSGPDHLAAIAPLVIKQRRGAWLTGLRWGVGHSSGVAAVGILSLILRDWLPMDLISSWSDRLVGVFLIALGVWTLRYVRVVTVGDGSFSRELCGGCHVERTGDIGLCTITGERGVAAGAAELIECRTTRSGSEFTRCVRG